MEFLSCALNQLLVKLWIRANRGCRNPTVYSNYIQLEYQAEKIYGQCLTLAVCHISF